MQDSPSKEQPTTDEKEDDENAGYECKHCAAMFMNRGDMDVHSRQCAQPKPGNKFYDELSKNPLKDMFELPAPIYALKSGMISSLMMAYIHMAIESGQTICVVGSRDARNPMVDLVRYIAKSYSNVYRVQSVGTLNGIVCDETPFSEDDFIHVNLDTPDTDVPMTALMLASTGRVNLILEISADSTPSFIHRMEQLYGVRRPLLPTIDFAIQCIRTNLRGRRMHRTKQIVEYIGIDPHSGEVLTNETFRWSPAVDEFEFYGKSYTLENIMMQTNMSKGEITKELKTRQEFFEFMVHNEIHDNTRVRELLHMYRTRPDIILMLMKGEITYNDIHSNDTINSILAEKERIAKENWEKECATKEEEKRKAKIVEKFSEHLDILIDEDNNLTIRDASFKELESADFRIGDIIKFVNAYKGVKQRYDTLELAQDRIVTHFDDIVSRYKDDKCFSDTVEKRIAKLDGILKDAEQRAENRRIAEQKKKELEEKKEKLPEVLKDKGFTDDEILGLVDALDKLKPLTDGEKKSGKRCKTIKCPRCKGPIEIHTPDRPVKMKCPSCGASGTLKK